MSYTGVGVIGSHVAHEPADDSGMVATRDITRRDELGRTVVIVPKGQPIPKGLAIDPDDATPAPPHPAAQPPDPRYLRRPEPDIGRQQARYSLRRLLIARPQHSRGRHR